MTICVQVNPSHIEAFKATWPCHGLSGFDYFVATFTEDGDLVDLNLWEIRSSDDHVEVDIGETGDALTALVDDAQKFGESETARVRLEQGGVPGEDGLIVHVLGDDLDDDDDDEPLLEVPFPRPVFRENF
jgi:hypothetical protein